ncbi:hypothetical protein CVT26_012876, partial [Gymnopilus dilepis]
IQRQRKSISARKIASTLGLLTSVTCGLFTQFSCEYKSRFEQRKDRSLSGPLLNVVLDRLQKASYSKTIKISPHLSSTPIPFLSSLTMSFLGLGKALGINSANFGAGRAGPHDQVHNGPQLPSSYYHPGLNIEHGFFSSSSVSPFSLPLLLGNGPFDQQLGGLSSGKGAQYTLPEGSMVAGHDFFSQAPTFVGSPQALSQLPTTPFPPASSWNLPSGHVVNTPVLGARTPQRVKVLKSSAGISATSTLPPPASTRFRYLQDSLKDHPSAIAEQIGGNNYAREDFWSFPSAHAELGLAHIRTLGHSSSVASEEVSSLLADPALSAGTNQEWDLFNDEYMSSIFGGSNDDFNASLDNDNSVGILSSQTPPGVFDTQATNDLLGAVWPWREASVESDPATEATRIPHSQIVVPGTSNTIASHGETKRTKKTNFDHGNDFGLVTSSRGISVEPQQRHTEYSGPSALADEWENQACNSNTSVHIPSTYSELAHALTPVVSTSTPNTTSPSSSTSSSQPHTAFPASPTNDIPSKTLLSISAPATVCQNDQPDGTLESGSICSSLPPPQNDDAPRPPVYSATHPPTQTAVKKRKFDDIEPSSMSSSQVPSTLQAGTNLQSLEASTAQSQDVDHKPKRRRGRPRKVDPPPPRKGFRPIVPREPIPLWMMAGHSRPIPSSSSGPSSRRAIRKENKAHGLKCPISAAAPETREALQETVDLDNQERGFWPPREIVLEPYEG